MAKSSSSRWAQSGSGTVTTVPSCPRRSDINFEQRLHSQKYSTPLSLLAQELAEGVNPESASSRKTLPSWRERNDEEQDGLAHSATIQNPSVFYTHSLLGGGLSSVTCATPQCDGQDCHHQHHRGGSQVISRSRQRPVVRVLAYYARSDAYGPTSIVRGASPTRVCRLGPADGIGTVSDQLIFVVQHESAEIAYMGAGKDSSNRPFETTGS